MPQPSVQSSGIALSLLWKQTVHIYLSLGSDVYFPIRDRRYDKFYCIPHHIPILRLRSVVEFVSHVGRIKSM